MTPQGTMCLVLRGTGEKSHSCFLVIVSHEHHHGAVGTRNSIEDGNVQAVGVFADSMSVAVIRLDK